VTLSAVRAVAEPPAVLVLAPAGAALRRPPTAAVAAAVSSSGSRSIAAATRTRIAPVTGAPGPLPAGVALTGENNIKVKHQRTSLSVYAVYLSIPYSLIYYFPSYLLFGT
jgi:hypothetical protein